jgi:hypothetical protein
MAFLRASGILALHSAQWVKDGPWDKRLCARLIPSFTVASI